MPFFDRKSPGLNGGFFPALLLVSVYGFTASLLFWRGTYKPALYLAAFAVAGLMVKFRMRLHPGRPFWVLFGLTLILFAQGCVMAGEKLTGNFHVFLLWFVLMVFAVTLFPERFGGRHEFSHRSLFAALLVVSVPIHILAYVLSAKTAEAALIAELTRIIQSHHIDQSVHSTGIAQMTEIARAAVLANTAGLFGNIHLLALYSVITLPILFYLFLRDKTVIRWVFVLALAGDFWLLLKTQSRPGFLALLAGSVATIPLLSVRRRLIALGATALVPALLYGTGVFGFTARINELIDHFAQEERLSIWRETWALLRMNTAVDWVFGHGFGQFLFDYKPYSSFHTNVDYSFPHNFILELLYSHGVVGLTLMAIACLGLYAMLFKSLSNTLDKSRRQIGILLISIITAHFVHTFLTLPVFSRPTLYPLSLILGMALRFLHPSSASSAGAIPAYTRVSRA